MKIVVLGGSGFLGSHIAGALSKKGHNKQEVLLRCIDTLKSYFNINKFKLNPSVYMIYTEIQTPY